VPTLTFHVANARKNQIIEAHMRVGDAVYLLDCGDGVGKQLQEALDPPGQQTTMKTLLAVFLTHLHSDHVVDYPNILLYGCYEGIEAAASPRS
jgi:ribonuclease BN (tRNA processing enzyme)